MTPPISVAVRLRSSCPELDAIFAGMSEQVSIQDVQHRYLYANKAVLQSFGEQLSDVLGRTWQELGAGGEIAAALAAQRDETIESGEPTRGTLPYSTDSGEGVVAYTISPLVGPEGVVQGTTTMSRVATDRPAAALEDETAAFRYRAVFEHSREGVLLIDGTITSMNPAAESILGLSIEDLKKSAFDDPHWLMVRGDGTAFPVGTNPLSVARATGEPVIDVLMGFFNPLTSTNHWLTVSAIPVISGDGADQETMTVVVFNDVTAEHIAGEEHREHMRRMEQQALERTAALYEVRGRLERANQHQRESENQASQHMSGTLRALAGVSEMRDPYTAGHQERVAGLAVAIAVELGWSAERRRFVNVAASLHDIGKLVVPAEILSKPAALSHAEFELVKSHAEAGAAILRHITFPWPVAEVIAQHHERMDGSGYPLGLSGERIRPEAMVIAVADVVEAVSSHRPYRAARGVEYALDLIRAGSGTTFDADVVDSCVAVFERGDFAFAEHQPFTFGGPDAVVREEPAPSDAES
ncbi:MAG: HD domain-containing protein [Coriobacteriia bacterium]|nr:HD domain-containing protein [Coriobacteriia bacterium]